MKYQGTIQRTTEPLFVYAGHFMKVRLSADVFSDSQENVELTIISTMSEPIEGGIYPQYFAEGEANQIISEYLTGGKGFDSISEYETEIRAFVKIQIANGVFSEVTK